MYIFQLFNENFYALLTMMFSVVLLTYVKHLKTHTCKLSINCM